MPEVSDYLRYDECGWVHPDEQAGEELPYRLRGDNIASAYWLYNRTADAWLLDLVQKMHEGSADYTTGIPTWHNINLAQGFREPLEYGLLANDSRFRKATYRNYRTVMSRYGQFPGGGFAGDENCCPGFDDPRQEFETCGIAEYMRSFEMLTRFTGDPVWADRCEELVFNALPAAFDPEQEGLSLHYQRKQRPAERPRGLAGVSEHFPDASLHAGYAPIPVLPTQLRHGVAVLRRRVVVGDVR